MPLHKDGILSRSFYPFSFGLMGFSTYALTNYINRRPYWAGIHRHVVASIVGCAFGYYMDKYLQRRFAERDAVIKHYIELHPEDFVENKRKYKEIFEEWYPVRGAHY